MSRFWGWYAQVHDDVRQKVVDEAWFGRREQDNPMERDVGAMEANTEQQNDMEPSDYGRELYGPAQAQEAEAADLYGQDSPEQEQ